MSSLIHRTGRCAALAVLAGPLVALAACAGRTSSPDVSERTAAGDVAAAARPDSQPADSLAALPPADLPPGGMPSAGGAAMAMRMSEAEMFTDPAIAASASVSNLSEILPSQLALQKAQHPRVRDFAQRMAQEHTRLETQMQQLLQQKGMAPEHNAFSYQMQENLQPMMRELESASGARFDMLYVAHLVSSHMTSLHALETTLIPNARDAEMRAMLEQQVRPMVAAHYAEVLGLQAELARAAPPADSMPPAGGVPPDSARRR